MGPYIVHDADVRPVDILLGATRRKGHLHGIGLVVEECEWKDAAASESPSVGSILEGRCDSEPHPRAVEVVTVHDGRSAYQSSIGILRDYVETGSLRRRDVLERAREFVSGRSIVECYEVVSLENQTRVRIVDVPDVIVVVPVDYYAVLYA